MPKPHQIPSAQGTLSDLIEQNPEAMTSNPEQLLLNPSTSQCRDSACAHRSQSSLCYAMPSRSLRQVIALFLGLVVSLSVSLSAVQASTMAAKMGTLSDKIVSLSDMGNSGQSHCKDCGAGDEGKMSGPPCASFCAPMFFAITVPAAPFITVPPNALDRIATAALVLAGRASPPDPYPPRPHNLV